MKQNTKANTTAGQATDLQRRRWEGIAQQAMIDARTPLAADMVIDAAATLSDIHPSHTLRLLRNAIFLGFAVAVSYKKSLYLYKEQKKERC